MDNNENPTDEVNDMKKADIENERNNNFNSSRESNKLGIGDIESSQSDSSKNIESREDRIKRLKEQSEIERQRKLAEIMESQKQSNELRQKQQIERRKKIEELKIRDEERRKGVEQRKKELDEKEKEKTESLQKRNKEREVRAALSQKPLRLISSSMSQSMISPRQNRMTASVHSNGTSSSSEKCMKKAGYGRWPSSCDVDKVSSYVSQAAGKASINTFSASNTRKRLQPPEGFLEVDGHFIPASTRHAGCFLPYKGPRYHVKGVLAWGPPPASVSEHGSSVAWWASMDTGSGSRKHQRASSAHASPVDSHNLTCPSVPSNINHAGVDYDNENAFASQIMRSNLKSLTPEKRDIKSKMSNRRIIQTTPTVKMVKAFSQHHLYSTLRSDEISGKDLTTPRTKNRSNSRNNVPASLATNSPLSSSTLSKQTTAKKSKDDDFFNRLSKPRSGSQPPKSDSKDTTDTSSKLMSTSFTKMRKSDKPIMKERRKSNPVEQNFIPTTSIKEVLTSPTTSDTNKDIDGSSQNNNVIADDVTTSTTKSSSRKSSKNLSKNTDLSDLTINQESNEEVAYKLKLAEQRRIAREKREEQMEEQKRIEEESRQKAALEKKRMEEEARMLKEAEIERARLLEEERLETIEKQRLLEEAEKKKKMETEWQLEENRLQKLRLEEEARMDRKRRLEKIMSRVKKPDGTSSPSNEENTGINELVENIGSNEEKNESLVEILLDEKALKTVTYDVNGDSQPTTAWSAEDDGSQFKLPDNDREDCSIESEPKENLQEINTMCQSDSPEQLSDTVLNLPGPQSQNSCNPQSLSQSQPYDQSQVGDPVPQFKSRLLQSMYVSGRLNSNKVPDNSSTNVTSSSNLSSIGFKDKRNSLIEDELNTDDTLLHSQSYHSDMSHLASNGFNNLNKVINGLSHDLVSENNIINGNRIGSDIHEEEILCNSKTNIDPSQKLVEKLEVLSDSSCSKISSDDCPPHSKIPELS